MKNKNVLLFSIAALLGSGTLMAQTLPNWKVGGNSLNVAGKFGTTNSQDVNFISNNVVNGALTKNGKWGFGLTLPSAKVQINSATGEDAFRVQVGGNTKLVLAANGGLTVGANNLNPPVAGLFVQGNTGIGTSTPLSKLHVTNGNSGTTPFSQSVITAESSTNGYINLLTPKANESGILFGSPTNNVDAGIIYNSTFVSPALNGLQFRTNGNFPRMILNKDGLLNIGPGGTEDYRVRIDHRDVLGLDIANSLSNTDWEIFAGTAGLSLFVDGGAGGPKGQFSRSTGVYSALSDERAKTNIKPMANVLEKIMKLSPTSYQYKEAKDKQEYDGFIAQQVMKVFPNLVTHNVETSRKVDQYLLNYSGFGVIAIKGIQELMKQNEKKDSAINALQKQIDELKAIVIKGNTNSTSSTATINTFLTNASLEQNVPNPFPNSTVISYNLPQKFSKANIVIADRSGRTMKQININGTGKGRVNVDASSLMPGTYNYSLIVDGKIIDSKQMIIAK